MTDKAYTAWVNFYMELADKLLPYAKDRAALIEKIKAVYNIAGIKMPKLERDGNVVDIDPFSVYSKTSSCLKCGRFL